MKTREDTARYIEGLMYEGTNEAWEAKDHKHHFGWWELRRLMDFMYEGCPNDEAQKLHSDKPWVPIDL